MNPNILSDIITLSEKLGCCTLVNEPLSKHTTFKVGGNCPLAVFASSDESIKSIIKYCTTNGVKLLVIGNGSNLLVSDKGFDGVVLIIGKDYQSLTLVDDTTIEVKSGCLLSQLCMFALQNELTGLEFAYGIPGTVGGAVYMNARCYDRSVSDVLLAADYARLGGDADGRPAVETYIMDSRQWDYKVSPFQGKLEGSPVLEVLLSVIPLDSAAADDMERRASSFVADREQKGHFSYPSAGSVFKNNRDFGKPSGRIVDEAGLRGLELGGAQVAPWHGNFIINRGNATAKDIRGLVELVQEEVCRKTGFLLEPEIIFLPKTR